MGTEKSTQRQIGMVHRESHTLHQKNTHTNTHEYLFICMGIHIHTLPVTWHGQGRYQPQQSLRGSVYLGGKCHQAACQSIVLGGDTHGGQQMAVPGGGTPTHTYIHTHTHTHTATTTGMRSTGTPTAASVCVCVCVWGSVY